MLFNFSALTFLRGTSTLFVSSPAADEHNQEQSVNEFERTNEEYRDRAINAIAYPFGWLNNSPKEYDERN